MRVFDAAATRAALPFERLIPALRELFASGACTVPPRQVLEIPAGADSPADALTSLVMPAWVPGRCYGVKTVNVAPANAARGLPTVHASYTLFDARTGVPLALLDGGELTARRTAAASALAASYLATADAAHLLVVGAGAVARLLPAAYRVVRPIRQLSVWARDFDKAQALAATLREQHPDIDVHAAPELEPAVRRANIVSCATLATTPLIQGAWLQATSHLDLIGSFTPTMREADDACFAGATLAVDTEEALRKSGDLLGPLSCGVLRESDVWATLATLCGHGPGAEPAPPPPNGRTVFKSVGTALEDLAAAMLAAEHPRSGS